MEGFRARSKLTLHYHSSRAQHRRYSRWIQLLPKIGRGTINQSRKCLQDLCLLGPQQLGKAGFVRFQNIPHLMCSSQIFLRQIDPCILYFYVKRASSIHVEFTIEWTASRKVFFSNSKNILHAMLSALSLCLVPTVIVTIRLSSPVTVCHSPWPSGFQSST